MPAKVITPHIISEIEQAFQQVGDYGSVEIYIQAREVTQITSRKINKTKHSLNGHSKHKK